MASFSQIAKMVMQQTAGSFGASYEIVENMSSPLHYLWTDVHGIDTSGTSTTVHSDHCYLLCIDE